MPEDEPATLIEKMGKGTHPRRTMLALAGFGVLLLVWLVLLAAGAWYLFGLLT